jgi:putative oxidoreductase
VADNRRTEDVVDTKIDPQRLMVPALAGFYQRLSPWSYALMRFSTGAILAPHGVQKVFFLPIDRYAEMIAGRGLPFPEALAYLTFFSESAAAVCLAVGLLTRLAAAVIAVEMLVVTFVFQWPFGFFWTNRGYEYPLLLALLCVAIVFRGGGRYSIDRLIGKEL